MEARSSRLLLSCLLLLAALVLGCDPKLLGTAGTGGTSGTGGSGTETPATVTPEALIVGNMVAFHTDLIAMALAVSADFDSASAALRSFDTGCATVTALSPPNTGLYRILFDGCSDAHGTEYRGGGELWVINNQDGYTYLPLFIENLLRATNETDDNYNFTTLSPASTAGSLEFAFERGQNGAVSAVRVGKFLRNGVRGDTVTLSYADVLYTGAIGDHPARPDAGSVVRVVWDGVGLFDVEFQGASATYSMQGGTYEVDLATGDVSSI